MQKEYTNVAVYATRLHEQLVLAGGVVSDYRLEYVPLEPPSSPDNITDGIARATYVRITTDLAVLESDLDLAVALHNILATSVDVPVITADGVEAATIMCDDEVLVDEVDCTVTVWRGSELYMLPTIVPVVGGVVALELASEVAGVFLIEIKLADGLTGYTEVEAV